MKSDCRDAPEELAANKDRTSADIASRDGGRAPVIVGLIEGVKQSTFYDDTRVV